MLGVFDGDGAGSSDDDSGGDEEKNEDDAFNVSSTHLNANPAEPQHEHKPILQNLTP